MSKSFKELLNKAIENQPKTIQVDPKLQSNSDVKCINVEHHGHSIPFELRTHDEIEKDIIKADMVVDHMQWLNFQSDLKDTFGYLDSQLKENGE